MWLERSNDRPREATRHFEPFLLQISGPRTIWNSRKTPTARPAEKLKKGLVPETVFDPRNRSF